MTHTQDIQRIAAQCTLDAASDAETLMSALPDTVARAVVELDIDLVRWVLDAELPPEAEYLRASIQDATEACFPSKTT